MVFRRCHPDSRPLPEVVQIACHVDELPGNHEVAVDSPLDLRRKDL